MPNAAPSPAPRPYVGSGRNGLITEDDARALLEEQTRSGMTLRDFARSRGLEPQRLSGWKSKFAGKHDRHAARPGRTADPRTSAAPTPSAAVVHSPADAYVLDLGRDVSLHIPHDFRGASRRDRSALRRRACHPRKPWSRSCVAYGDDEPASREHHHRHGCGRPRIGPGR